MNFYLTLPLIFLRFWFLEAPVGLFAFFSSLNKAFLEMFSFTLLVKTYFKPWKNEYRKGLVGFSIGMGMFIKTFMILADLFIFIFLILTEMLIIIGFVGMPVMGILLLIS